MAERVILFIDYQNMYQGARRAFFERHDFHIYGQFDPLKLGDLLTGSGKSGSQRVLKQVRVYSGRPDATKQPKAYSAHMKNCASWLARGVSVTTRTLRYPHNWPVEKESEKGIDVALTTDFVTMAMGGEYDVGILASADTDMTPALEYVARHPNLRTTVEVTAWRSERARRRLTVSGINVWCH